MKNYIAFLRAINVGGHRKIKMADLRALIESLGFQNVKTYIQSGNTVFAAPPEQRDELANIIKKQIEDSFGHDVQVLIREPEELKNILAGFPFKEKDGWKGYIGFLSDKPDSESIKNLESQSSAIEQFKISDDNLYVFVDKETNQKANFSNGFIEKELGLHATTRNLRTVQKILNMASADTQK